jgi:mRNA interferase MazF
MALDGIRGVAGVRRTRARRGDVCWVALDPVVGTEIQKTRPAVIVSNDAMNQYGARVVVVPVTSNVDHCYPGEALITVKGKAARALGDQLRSIDKARLRGKVDTLVASEMQQLDAALRVTLEL